MIASSSKAESRILLSFVKGTSSVAEIKVVYGNRVILSTTRNSSFNCLFLFAKKSRQFRRLRQKPTWNGEKFVILWSSFFVFLPFHSDNDWIERQSVKIFRYCLPFPSRALRSSVGSRSADICMRMPTVVKPSDIWQAFGLLRSLTQFPDAHRLSFFPDPTINQAIKQQQINNSQWISFPLSPF